MPKDSPHIFNLPRPSEEDFPKFLREGLSDSVLTDIITQATELVSTITKLLCENMDERTPVEKVLQNCNEYAERILIATYWEARKHEREYIYNLITKESAHTSWAKDTTKTKN